MLFYANCWLSVTQTDFGVQMEIIFDGKLHFLISVNNCISDTFSTVLPTRIMLKNILLNTFQVAVLALQFNFFAIDAHPQPQMLIIPA